MRPGQYLTRSLVYVDNRGRRRCRQRAGRAGRRHVRQDAGAGRSGFVRSYALSMLGGSALVVLALLAVKLHERKRDVCALADDPGCCCRWSGRVVVMLLPARHDDARCPSRSRSGSPSSRS